MQLCSQTSENINTAAISTWCISHPWEVHEFNFTSCSSECKRTCVGIKLAYNAAALVFTEEASAARQHDRGIITNAYRLNGPLAQRWTRDWQAEAGWHYLFYLISEQTVIRWKAADVDVSECDWFICSVLLLFIVIKEKTALLMY